MPMSILASVCWEAGFVWLCGGWVCGIPRVVACSRAVCWFGARVWLCALLCARALACWRGRVGVCWLVWRVWVCACLFARVCVGGPRLCARPPLGGVLWRFPTLPHPLGCSTIGAAGLSFQVRNVAGRFPGAVTTTRLCRPPCWPAVWCGGVGGGLVVVRIVVAAPSRPPLLPCLGPCSWARRGVGGVWLPVPPVVAPCLVSGAGGPWPSSLWRC